MNENIQVTVASLMRNKPDLVDLLWNVLKSYQGADIYTEVQDALCDWSAWYYAITVEYTIPFNSWKTASGISIKTAYWPEGDVLYMMDKPDKLSLPDTE